MAMLLIESQMKRIQTIPIRNCALVCLTALVSCGIGIRAAGQEAPLSTGTETPQAHLGEGYEALRQDRYEVAVKEFRAALALDPKLVLRARFPLAVALFELHQGDEARREFEEVRKEAGDHANIAYYLGRLDLDDGKFDEAVQNLEKAAVKPPFPDTAYFLGYAYSKKDELAAAKKWLNEAAKMNPRDARVPFQLGQIYRREGRGDEAKKALALSQELRQRDSTESKLRLECSQKLEVDQLDEARKVCDQLYDPDDPDRLTELGTLYGRHGDLEDALRPLRRAAEIAPQSPQVQYNLAFAYFQMNRLAEARAPLEGALKRWPDLFQLNALYGAVLFKLGETAEAYRALSAGCRYRQHVVFGSARAR